MKGDVVKFVTIRHGGSIIPVQETSEVNQVCDSTSH